MISGSSSLFSFQYLYDEMEKQKIYSSKIKDRINLFLKALTRFDPLNLKMICSLSFHGIPDEIRPLRALYWRIILGYLPENKNKWSMLIEKNRIVYESFVDDFVTKRNLEIYNMGQEFLELCDWERFISYEDVGLDGSLDLQAKNERGINNENDKISVETKKKVKDIYLDLCLWDEIEKDTKRTRSELHFFVSKSNTDKKKPLLSKLNLCLNPKLRVWNYEKKEIVAECELHNDVLTRILFIYAKLNPGIKYVQGMNEIAGTLYYCFSADKSEAFLQNIESDVFFCFTMIMGEIKDGFIRNLDGASTGLKGRINDLNNLLKKIDYPLWDHFEKQKVNPYFYSLRWIMLLLTQEFELHDTLRLWDSLLSHPNKTLYLNYCCVAIIEKVRGELMKEDFSGIMEKLQQNIAENDIQQILGLAYKLYLESGEEPISTFLIM